VETVQKLRRALPEQAKLVVAKNNLMKVAVQDTNWTTIAEKGCTVSAAAGAALRGAQRVIA
jgi:ribosomal protein L10